MRRSLLVWGWGQLATGDARGALLPVAQIGAIVGLWNAVPYLSGTSAPLLFLAAALVLAAWAGISVHAYRRAVRRREVFGLSAADGSAIELLALAPVLVAGWAFIWTIARPAASVESALADYIGLWAEREPVAAVERFVSRPSPAELLRAWDNQLAALRDELVRLDAEHPDAGIDPARPLETVRFDSLGGGQLAVTVARRETVRELLFGLLPMTSQRRTPISRLGTVRLRTVDDPAPIPGGPPVRKWRIEFVEILGERAGG